MRAHRRGGWTPHGARRPRRTLSRATGKGGTRGRPYEVVAASGRCAEPGDRLGEPVPGGRQETVCRRRSASEAPSNRRHSSFDIASKHSPYVAITPWISSERGASPASATTADARASRRACDGSPSRLLRCSRAGRTRRHRREFRARPRWRYRRAARMQASRLDPPERASKRARHRALDGGRQRLGGRGGRAARAEVRPRRADGRLLRRVRGLRRARARRERAACRRAAAVRAGARGGPARARGRRRGALALAVPLVPAIVLSIAASGTRRARARRRAARRGTPRPSCCRGSCRRPRRRSTRASPRAASRRSATTGRRRSASALGAVAGLVVIVAFDRPRRRRVRLGARGERRDRARGAAGACSSPAAASAGRSGSVWPRLRELAEGASLPFALQGLYLIALPLRDRARRRARRRRSRTRT